MTEGSFQWSSSQQLTFADWYQGPPIQPDDKFGEDLLSNADCVLLNAFYSYQWTDESCSSSAGSKAICEFCCQKRIQKPTEQSLAATLFATKTEKKFSCLAFNQADEQNNAHVKADGGAVRLTENPGALHRWMGAGPEMKTRTIDNFPPTHDELHQHTKRTAYQGSVIWAIVLVQIQVCHHQIYLDGKNLMVLGYHSCLCLLTLKCHANISSPEKGCLGACKCLKAALKCTALCNCPTDCERETD
ncbi:Hypothetical predicted protein [Mytilus galloprovincialis]|uniref:C-type lectin domain-containing protein n=1 Tax=Mytilus galloprovincialis TaxID=29158 RepID=A0A8B6H705_MYTGA|nr:Hypothetical predicted protein [Mytilus galloprovincialis]